MKLLRINGEVIFDEEGNLIEMIRKYSADLSYADLSYADLSSANLDFSCWPLWCGSIKVKLDIKLKRQLLYHLLAVAPEYCSKKLIAEANKFHRIGEVPNIELPNTNISL